MERQEPVFMKGQAPWVTAGGSGDTEGEGWTQRTPHPLQLGSGVGSSLFVARPPWRAGRPLSGRGDHSSLAGSRTFRAWLETRGTLVPFLRLPGQAQVLALPPPVPSAVHLVCLPAKRPGCGGLATPLLSLSGLGLSPAPSRLLPAVALRFRCGLMSPSQGSRR